MRKKILIVEDNVALAKVQKEWLGTDGFEVMTVMDEPAARKWIARAEFDLILADVRLPRGNGISLLEWMNWEGKDIPYIIMTEYASFPDAVKAIKLGAKDYLPKPVYRERLLELVAEQVKALSVMQSEQREYFRRPGLKAREAEHLARLVAPFDLSVLILGENGTGKEEIAKSIHFNSPRKHRPFVAVNCGAIPRELSASLFFGYKKGAFTGADRSEEGYFETARGGTLFLDEIGTLPYETQSALLRVLQENVYLPIGGNRERTADVRIVAATNEDMEEAIGKRFFREDLYHRLCEFEIRLPPLRECQEDILPLAEFFRKKFSGELRKETAGFTKEAERLLLTHSWSGNIRELRNRVRRAVLVSESSRITEKNLGIAMIPPSPKIEPEQFVPLRDARLEKDSIIKALEICRGNKTQAARLLNVNPTTLYRKINKYGIE